MNAEASCDTDGEVVNRLEALVRVLRRGEEN